MEVFFSNLWCLKTSLQTAMSREWRNIFILLSIYKLSLDIHIRIAIANKFSDDMDETSLVCRTFKSQEYLQPHNEIALCLYSDRESLIANLKFKKLLQVTHQKVVILVHEVWTWGRNRRY